MADQITSRPELKKKIRTHRDLDVYSRAHAASMTIFELTKRLPKEEMYSLTDQIRRSSRSVCANLAEAWRKRRYPNAFISKLCDVEEESAETQVWLEYTIKCGYINRSDAAPLYKDYDRCLATLVGMIRHADTWTIQPQSTRQSGA